MNMHASNEARNSAWSNGSGDSHTHGPTFAQREGLLPQGVVYSFLQTDFCFVFAINRMHLCSDRGVCRYLDAASMGSLFLHFCGKSSESDLQADKLILNRQGKTKFPCALYPKICGKDVIPDREDLPFSR